MGGEHPYFQGENILVLILSNKVQCLQRLISCGMLAVYCFRS